MSTQPGTEYVPEWTDGDKLRKVRRHLGLTQEEFTWWRGRDQLGCSATESSTPWLQPRDDTPCYPTAATCWTTGSPTTTA